MEDRITEIQLSRLLENLPDWERLQVPNVNVTGVVMDSRQVQPGHLFVAVKGDLTDGHHYITDAIHRGASAVVGTQPLSNLPLPYFRVPDSRLALAYLAAAYHGMPTRRLLVIGVTGTDGKTTTANLIFNILNAAGLQVGMITTVNAVIGDRVMDTGFHVTTPEAPVVQAYLAKMAAAGLTHVVLEATSHGLAQHRVTACDFDVGVVTNITHEHLDYHGTYEAYRDAKASLFTSLAATPDKGLGVTRTAILNRDDTSFDHLSDITLVRKLSYGQDPNADFLGMEIASRSDGLDFVMRWLDASGRQTQIDISSPLVGVYNVGNCLAAAAVALGGLGLEHEAVRAGIASMQGIPGRMEPIDLGQDFFAIVDFAHTPNALANALSSARMLTSGRVIVVFGSAGLRDRAKRRLMAQVAAEMADLTILTAEDPRTESLPGILAEMAAGMDSRGGVEGRTYWRVPDRREALRFAVRLAKADDLVIACGKGHEQSMCFEETEYLWDDRVALRAALADHIAVPGPEMPFLPDPG